MEAAHQGGLDLRQLPLPGPVNLVPRRLAVLSERERTALAAATALRGPVVRVPGAFCVYGWRRW